MSAGKLLKLNSGYEMPIIGLGTYLVKDKDTIMKIIDAALSSGYRAFDTAEVYQNEAFVGEAFQKYLPKYQLKREDIFITSKLDPGNQGHKPAGAAIKETMANLKTPYLDLFLIHWPGTTGLDHSDPKNAENRAGSWLAMEEAVKAGTFRSIGVSNYTIKHLEQLLKACDVKPSVNQVEFHPYLYQKELLEYCKKQGIVLEAYSSLGSQSSQDVLRESIQEINSLDHDKVVGEIAKELKKEPAQVLLRWAIQHNIPIIPKSQNPDRVKTNFQIFDFTLSDEQMAKLDALNKDKHFTWNPTDVV